MKFQNHLSSIEDPSINRMTESLRLFGTICNNRWFVTSSMILFLNKIDVFKNKLEKQNTSIASCFPKFCGNEYDYEETTNFIQVLLFDSFFSGFRGTH